MGSSVPWSSCTSRPLRCRFAALGVTNFQRQPTALQVPGLAAKESTRVTKRGHCPIWAPSVSARPPPRCVTAPRPPGTLLRRRALVRTLFRSQARCFLAPRQWTSDLRRCLRTLCLGTRTTAPERPVRSLHCTDRCPSSRSSPLLPPQHQSARLRQLARLRLLRHGLLRQPGLRSTKPTTSDEPSAVRTPRGLTSMRRPTYRSPSSAQAPLLCL